MRRMLLVLGGVLVLAILGLFFFLVHVLLASGDATYWEGEIAAFERLDVSNPPPANGILFVGGRDLRLWERLVEDMAPVPVIQRGFGGAQVTHITHYLSRIILPYRPRAIIVMAGNADLADVRGRRPEDVLNDFRTLVLALREEHVRAPVYFVSLLPSPGRDDRWLGAQRANALVADYVRGEQGVFFLDVTASMLDSKGNIREELYRWDGLTLNDEGYAILADAIRPVLMGAGYGGEPVAR